MTGPILFFDGVCNLCNGFIDLLLRHGFQGKVSTLQGETAKMVLPMEDREGMMSVIYWRNHQLLRQGQAIRWALKDSQGLLRFLGILLSVVPLGVTNWVYKVMASNRYRIFGKKESCRLPTEAEKEKFLP